MQPTQSSTLRRIVGRDLASHHDVRDREAPARLEHAERLGQHAVLVGREVDHAVRDDDVDRVVGQRNVLDLALQELDVLQAGLPLVLARQRQHLVRHVEPVGLARRARRAAPTAARRCRRPTRDRARSRPAAASASAVGLPQPSDASDGLGGQPAGLLRVVEVGRDGIDGAGHEEARAAAAAGLERRPQHCPRRRSMTRSAALPYRSFTTLVTSGIVRSSCDVAPAALSTSQCLRQLVGRMGLVPAAAFGVQEAQQCLQRCRVDE